METLRRLYETKKRKKRPDVSESLGFQQVTCRYKNTEEKVVSRHVTCDLAA